MNGVERTPERGPEKLKPGKIASTGLFEQVLSGILFVVA
jgi:hypothetical protein